MILNEKKALDNNEAILKDQFSGEMVEQESLLVENLRGDLDKELAALNACDPADSKRLAKARKKVEKARKAFKTELEKHTLPIPVEFWSMEEEEEDNILYKKETKHVILATLPLFNISPRTTRKAMELLDSPSLELNSSKFMVAAELFYKERVELSDLNGNPIPENTPNVYVLACPVKEQVVLAAIYRKNLEAIVNGEEKTSVKNCHVKAFSSVQEYAAYTGTNTQLERALKGTEKMGIAALANAGEFMKHVQAVCKAERLPAGIAMKYYCTGKKVNTALWDSITRGEQVELTLDLELGDRIIKTLKEVGFEQEIRKNYLIDALIKHAGTLSSETNQPVGMDRTLELLKKFQQADIEFIKYSPGDKVTEMTNRLAIFNVQC